jgi:putative hydrolase of the HAD superfamily
MIAAAPLFRYSSPMTGTRLRAVIFDYGEVLSLPQDAEARVRLQALSGLPGELFRREYRRCRPPFDRGELSGAAYWTRVLGAGNGTVDPALIPSLLRVDAESWSRVNPAVLAWSRSLREAGYRTAVLSNMPAENLAFLEECHPWLEEFPVRVFSCRLGIIKPEPGIYTRCLEALEVSPAEALFLDDIPGNVAAARALGIRAALFRSAAETLPALAARYGLPAPAPAGAEPD